MYLGVCVAVGGGSVVVGVLVGEGVGCKASRVRIRCSNSGPEDKSTQATRNGKTKE